VKRSTLPTTNAIAMANPTTTGRGSHEIKNVRLLSIATIFNKNFNPQSAHGCDNANVPFVRTEKNKQDTEGIFD
jgi:hypothetical protein